MCSRCGCGNPRTGRLCRIDRFYTVAPSGAGRAIIVLDIKKIAGQRDVHPSGCGRPYTPPKLKEFGPVGALTQSGSTGGKEQAAMLMQNML